MRFAAILLLFSSFAGAAPVLHAEDVTESRTGVKYAAKAGETSLLGMGLRTKTFLKVKVYVIGLYVADTALAAPGPLAAFKGRTASPEFARALVTGDFPKELRLQLVRDVSASQIQGAWREALEAADKARVETFVSYFGDTKIGQEYLFRWAPGGTLEVQVAGQAKPPIADRKFAEAVFGIWLGDKPIQEDVKKDLVARAEGLLH